jgi:hypothetical protein
MAKLYGYDVRALKKCMARERVTTIRELYVAEGSNLYKSIPELQMKPMSRLENRGLNNSYPLCIVGSGFMQFIKLAIGFGAFGDHQASGADGVNRYGKVRMVIGSLLSGCGFLFQQSNVYRLEFCEKLRVTILLL